VAVNHLDGHVHATFLEAYQNGKTPKLPAVCLIVSGGHTVLYEVKHGADAGHDGAFAYRKLGQTRDDAAGEAYDKVAKLLGLGYPGGPILDRLAAATAANTKPPVKFGPTKTRGNALDFSFSGLKTAVLYHVREYPEYTDEIRKREEAVAAGKRGFAELLPLCSAETLGLVREFQSAVVRDLVERTMLAAEECEVQTLLVSGGVSANSGLRAVFAERAQAKGLEVFFPDRALSTDNAAMIAAAAYGDYVRGRVADVTLNAKASMAMG